MMLKKFFFAIFCLIFSFESQASPFVTAEIKEQMGNNMFQVATASALAWDNGAEPIFPDLANESVYYFKQMFFRCNTDPLPEEVSLVVRNYFQAYLPFEYIPNMKISGWFQSEKYFAHHRERILELFAPSDEDLTYIREKYAYIFRYPCTVGIQLRRYYEDPQGFKFPQFGKDYLKKAVKQFPKNALFIVSSNDLKFARSQMPKRANAIYLTGEQPYIDMHILSMCDHNIISNSSFGWWAAWMNQNPHKKVVCPHLFLLTEKCWDYYPKNWVKIKAKYGGAMFPDKL